MEEVLPHCRAAVARGSQAILPREKSVAFEIPAGKYGQAEKLSAQPWRLSTNPAAVPALNFTIKQPQIKR